MKLKSNNKVKENKIKVGDQWLLLDSKNQTIQDGAIIFDCSSDEQAQAIYFRALENLTLDWSDLEVLYTLHLERKLNRVGDHLQNLELHEHNIPYLVMGIYKSPLLEGQIILSVHGLQALKDEVSILSIDTECYENLLSQYRLDIENAKDVWLKNPNENLSVSLHIREAEEAFFKNLLEEGEVCNIEQMLDIIDRLTFNVYVKCQHNKFFANKSMLAEIKNEHEKYCKETSFDLTIEEWLFEADKYRDCPYNHLDIWELYEHENGDCPYNRCRECEVCYDITSVRNDCYIIIVDGNYIEEQPVLQCEHWKNLEEFEKEWALQNN